MYEEIKAWIKKYQKTADVLEQLPIQEACRNYRAMRELEAELKELTSRINKAIEICKTEKMPMLFQEAGVRSITVDDYRFTISETVRASIIPEVKQEAYEWLRENDLGELITETVNASTLAAQARRMAEEGYELDPDFFRTYVLPNVSVTKA